MCKNKIKNGSGSWIRTNEMWVSEAHALPLGDTAIIAYSIKQYFRVIFKVKTQIDK